MHLLLIFALAFMLSAQGNNKDGADAESTENANGIMKKVINAIGENGLTKVMNSFKEHDLDKLTECTEGDCKMTDFLDLMQKILSVVKKTSHVDKLVYQVMEKGNEIMGELINVIGEEGREQVMKSLNDDDLDKLTECIASECEMAVFVDLLQKILSVLKGMSHGDKLIYQMMKAIIKQGTLAELINTIGEQHTLEIINALDAAEIEKLMNTNTTHVSVSELMSIGKKIIPIIKKANGGKGLSKLISILTNNKGEGKTVLPYLQPVSGGLHPGMAVYLQGTASKHSKKFYVNFLCDQDGGSNSSLYFYPNFDTGRLSLWTCLARKWGNSEDHKMPLRKGEHFEIFFIVDHIGYQILVNGEPFCRYNHRLLPQSVRKIRVDGDLELHRLSVMGAQMSGNMTLPYHYPVPDGLHPGMSVYVQGKVPKHPKRSWVNFYVNFVCAKHKGAHIPFHFRPHMNSKIIVLNTLQARRWGKEEKHNNPFQKGEPFELIFTVTEAEYQMLLNGKFFFTYKHRMLPQSVQDILVDGDLELQSLTVMGRPTMGNTMMTNPVFYQPTVPYTSNIPGGLGANKTITMRGFIPKNATRFEISFMAGQDIALHINPRIKPWTYVVRNSLLNNQWGTEEHDLPFNPFQPGKYFELSIYCGNHEFKVYTNGHHLFNYAHRYVPMEHIQTIKITGDVTLSYIKY